MENLQIQNRKSNLLSLKLEYRRRNLKSEYTQTDIHWLFRFRRWYIGTKFNRIIQKLRCMKAYVFHYNSKKVFLILQGTTIELSSPLPLYLLHSYVIEGVNYLLQHPVQLTNFPRELTWILCKYSKKVGSKFHYGNLTSGFLPNEIQSILKWNLWILSENSY